MPKFCVKYPYIVLVSVLALLILGATAFSKMQTDFLPNMNLPYALVMTSYPGASPEKIEKDITDPIEAGIATISGVKRVESISAENASQIMLEFENGTDMDSAMVKISSAMDLIELPEEAAKPYIMEVSMDMMPVTYVSVDYDGKSGSELSTFIESEILPEIKRQDGVASVQTLGIIEDHIQIALDEDKVKQLNDKIKDNAEENLDAAADQLAQAQGAISSGKQQVATQKKKLKKNEKKTANKMAKYIKLMNQALAGQAAASSQYTSLSLYQQSLEQEKAAYQALADSLATIVDAGVASDGTKAVYANARSRVAQVTAILSGLDPQVTAAKTAKDTIDSQVTTAQKNYTKVEAGKMTAAAAFGSAQSSLASAEADLEKNQQELDANVQSFEETRQATLKNANADKLLTLDTLSALIKAQNFSMPAGYITGDDRDYVLKVDEEIKSIDEIKDFLIAKIDGVGDVRISDVATVKMVNNENDNYAKLNGNPAVIIAVYKNSTKGTATVSDNVEAAVKKLEDKNDGLRFTSLMDQGQYIDLITDRVMKNLMWGALLAMLVLLLFLRKIRPTIVVALSIPLSVFCALLLMYFSGITLNIISLSGLALGIGMLVDNSIVVMENIYRLRSEGVPAARAAIEGTGQVQGAIGASTLTTISVFVPMLFTEGLTRELMLDMCLTIVFSLLASLVVALAVVPPLSASLLNNVEAPHDRILEKIKDKYEVLLRACLRNKAIPILVGVILLVVCTIRIVDTGIITIPDMESTQMSMTMTTSKETSKEDDFATMDDIAEKIGKLEGVKTVGAIQSATLGMDPNGKRYTAMVLLDEDYADQNKKIKKKIEKILGAKDLEEYEVTSQNMDTSTMLGAGLEVDIYGSDDEKLLKIATDIMKIAEDVKGFENISNGQDAPDDEVVIDIDKDKAMREGLTVAQIYSALQGKLTTEKDVMTVDIDGDSIDVKLVDERDELTRDNLLDYKFNVDVTGANGAVQTKSFSLADFAILSERKALSEISHIDSSKVMTVTANAKDGYNTELLSRKVKQQLKEYKVPKGYKVEVVGESESVEEMVKDMLTMMLVAIALIYLIMVAQFRSFKMPFIIILTVPLAFTGGFLALMLAGMELSMVSLMGFLILSGVIVNNGIVFVDYVNKLRDKGESVKEALVMAGRTRMRPILMTALTTIFAMIILATSHGEGAAMARGMATVTIGGLIYATLMTLIIVPVVYDIFAHKRSKM